MGIFDRKDENKERTPDFSDVRGGSSTTDPLSDSQVERGTESDRGGRNYTVVAGDSLSKIAKREYGDGNQWRRIYEANKDQIKDPDLIYPGQTFTIPAAGESRGGL